MGAPFNRKEDRTYTEKFAEFALEYPTGSIPPAVKEKVINLIIGSWLRLTVYFFYERFLRYK